MSLAPRVVLVHRATELEELLARHGTRGQAEFFLTTRGRAIAPVDERHALQHDALSAVTRAIPLDWRRGSVERADLARFSFAPGDVVVVVGQDGLVANVAKYLHDQPVIGINPDVERNPGVLVPDAPGSAAELLAVAAAGEPSRIHQRTMVEIRSDDGQSLRALNEIFVGPATHQTARYALHQPGGGDEHQASSGLIVSTGTGATGWCRSIWLEHHSRLELPAPGDPRLAWFVREAWPSPATGTTLTEGILGDRESLVLDVECDTTVAFGDGIESDFLTLTWGQRVTVGVAAQSLHLVH
jgi:hypothetical protein